MRGTVEVIEALGDNQYRLFTAIESADGSERTLTDGEAVALIDMLPEP